MIDLIRFYYKGKDKMGFTDFFTFNDFKIVLGGNDKQNRAAVENKNLDILLSPEIIRGRDFMHSRDSGLNQVLCTLAYKNNIAIGFNFSDVLKTRTDSLDRDRHRCARGHPRELAPPRLSAVDARHSQDRRPRQQNGSRGLQPIHVRRDLQRESSVFVGSGRCSQRLHPGERARRR